MNYSDICLIPQKGIVKSRQECDTSIYFANYKWKLPVIPANMKTVIDFNLAEWCARNGYFYILHRFYPYEQIFDWIQKHQDIYVSISVGVKEVDKAFLRGLRTAGLRINCITVDIAHGFSVGMEEMLNFINNLYNAEEKPFIIAGNVFGNGDSINFLKDLKVDCIKVGLAYGKACRTYNQTGFASPMFQAGRLASACGYIPLIGDGGVQENGDIVKGLVAGYSMIMCGSIFAQCLNSPAELKNGQKQYFGSASSYNTGSQHFIEGDKVVLECNGLTFQEKMVEIEESLKSAISYAGGKDLSCLKNVDYIKNNS